jgi:thymidylate synthase (FAD)
MKAELLDVFGDDLMVVNTARVSMGKWHTEFDQEGDAKLISFLAKNDHWSPFAHPKAQFRVTMPIFIARQWEKHRVGAVRGYDIYDHNEISRRYVDDEPEFWAPAQWRKRPEGSIKQGSGAAADGALQAIANYDLQEIHRYAKTAYQRMIRDGIAPEQARTLLPQSTYTTWIETGSLYYWANLCRLRTDAHAQQEIQQLAWQVADQMVDKFPVSWVALMRHNK